MILNKKNMVLISNNYFLINSSGCMKKITNEKTVPSFFLLSYALIKFLFVTGFLLIFLSICTKSFASDPLLIDKNFYKLFPGKNIEYLVDSKESLTIKKIKETDLNWKKSTSNILSFGYIKDTHWFKLNTNVKLNKNRFYYFVIQFKYIYISRHFNLISLILE